jgi:hypothetical protein
MLWLGVCIGKNRGMLGYFNIKVKGVINAMANIKLNDILGLSDDEISNSKIELNMQAGGEAYIDRWLYCNGKDKENGTCPECGY